MKNSCNLKWQQLLKNIPLLVMLLMASATCYSQSDNPQDKVVFGSLITSDSSPLPGATITVKGTTRGTTTDFDGQFSIKAKEGDILVISYAGFSTEEFTIGEENVLNIVLKADSNSSTYWCCTSHSDIPHCAPNKSELEPSHPEDEVYIIKGP